MYEEGGRWVPRPPQPGDVPPRRRETALSSSLLKDREHPGYF